MTFYIFYKVQNGETFTTRHLSRRGEKNNENWQNNFFSHMFL